MGTTAGEERQRRHCHHVHVLRMVVERRSSCARAALERRASATDKLTDHSRPHGTPCSRLACITSKAPQTTTTLTRPGAGPRARQVPPSCVRIGHTSRPLRASGSTAKPFPRRLCGVLADPVVSMGTDQTRALAAAPPVGLRCARRNPAALPITSAPDLSAEHDRRS